MEPPSTIGQGVECGTEAVRIGTPVGEGTLYRAKKSVMYATMIRVSVEQ